MNNHQDDEPKASLESLIASAPQKVSEQPDDLTLAEQRVNTAGKLTELTGRQQDIDERKRYALRFFILGCAWVTVISAILLLQGFGSILRFKLSDSIVLAAIGSTTVNVVGIMYVVANYLFPKSLLPKTSSTQD